MQPFAERLANSAFPTVTTQPSPTLTATASPQQVQWIPSDDKQGSAGLCINWVPTMGSLCANSADFVPWTQFKSELEQKVLPQTDVPQGSTLKLLPGNDGQPNWFIQILTPDAQPAGYVAIGENPSIDVYDGLIRVVVEGLPATTKSTATFQRYSDGSYLKR